MNRSQKQAKLVELEQIENFIMSCGFVGVSDSSSDNKIYSKNDSVIIIQKKHVPQEMMYRRDLKIC